MTTTISVVIPTYNSAWVIRETLASVLKQRRLPSEVIVVDDASKDNTCAIVEMIAQTAPCPIRLIRMSKNSGGPVRGMNVGVESATSNTFTILDHDDLLAPHAIEEYHSAWEQLDQATFGIVTSDFLMFDSTGVTCPSLFARQGVLTGLFAEVAGGAPLVISAAQARDLTCRKFCLPMKGAIARSAWKNCGGFDERFRSAWDNDFTWRLASRYSFAVINQPLVQIRLHKENLSHVLEVVGPEILHVYRHMRRDVQDSTLRDLLLQKINNELFDMAYYHRGRAKYLRAAWYYVQLLMNKLGRVTRANAMPTNKERAIGVR